jgi:hypothetical protein
MVIGLRQYLRVYNIEFSRFYKNKCLDQVGDNPAGCEIFG